MINDNYILVNKKILPPIYERVLLAKELLANGTAANSSQAAKMVGISRSAFYKYRESVFRYTSDSSNSVNLIATLADRKGVFSAMTAVLGEHGANITTVSQGMPVDSVAPVSMTVRTDSNADVQKLIEALEKTDGIISVRTI